MTSRARRSLLSSPASWATRWLFRTVVRCADPEEAQHESGMGVSRRVEARRRHAGYGRPTSAPPAAASPAHTRAFEFRSCNDYLSPFKGCVEVSVEVFYDAGRRDGVVRPCRHACRSRRLGHLDYFIKYHLPPSRTGLSGVGTRLILPFSLIFFAFIGFTVCAQY